MGNKFSWEDEMETQIEEDIQKKRINIEGIIIDVKEIWYHTKE